MGDIGAVEEAGISEPLFIDGSMVFIDGAWYRAVRVRDDGAVRTFDLEPVEPRTPEQPAPSPERTEPATPASA